MRHNTPIFNNDLSANTNVVDDVVTRDCPTKAEQWRYQGHGSARKSYVHPIPRPVDFRAEENGSAAVVS